MENNILLFQLALTCIRRAYNIDEVLQVFRETVAKNDEEAYFKSLIKWELVRLDKIKIDHMCGFCDLYYNNGKIINNEFEEIPCFRKDSDCPVSEECDKVFEMNRNSTRDEIVKYSIDALRNRKDEFTNRGIY